jgi:hypothetical protein
MSASAPPAVSSAEYPGRRRDTGPSRDNGRRRTKRTKRHSRESSTLLLFFTVDSTIDINMDETEPPLRSDETDSDAGDDDDDEQVRFEDLTVNDDLPLLDRVVRYTRSQIALQRLCHVKMLAETAELAG